MGKYYKSQFEGASTGQHWGKWSTKITEFSRDLKSLENRNSWVHRNNRWMVDSKIDRHTGMKAGFLLTGNDEGWTSKHAMNTELENWLCPYHSKAWIQWKSPKVSKYCINFGENQDICTILMCLLIDLEEKENSNYIVKKLGKALTERRKFWPPMGIICLQRWCPERDTASTVKYSNGDCIARN